MTHNAKPFDSARQEDVNGYVTISRNSISRAGVFPYSGRSLPGADPNKMYYVYRPAEELSSPEAIESFKLLPIYDEHEMTGEGYPTAPEDKGIHGSTGEDIVFEGRDVLAPLRIFSRTLKRLIDSGKKGLSLGYRCAYEKTSGVFDGITYHYIQRNIRGNHLALVTEGRCGTAVLDQHWAFDHFDLALDTQEKKDMADEEKKKEAEAKDNAAEGEGEKEMTLTEITGAIRAIMPLMKTIEEFMAAGAAKTETAALDEEAKKKEDEEKKKAEDEAEKEKAKKEEGMDKAELTDIKTRLAGVEKRGVKDMLSTIAARDIIVKEVTPLVGTFAHDEMTADEVAVYACDKLELKPEKGQERAALDGFLAGRKSAEGTVAAFALDTKPKEGGLLSKRLNGLTAA